MCVYRERDIDRCTHVHMENANRTKKKKTYGGSVLAHLVIHNRLYVSLLFFNKWMLEVLSGMKRHGPSQSWAISNCLNHFEPCSKCRKCQRGRSFDRHCMPRFRGAKIIPIPASDAMMSCDYARVWKW